MSQLVQRQTTLSGNIISFSRYLRTKGYTITTSEERDALKAIQLVPPHTERLYRDVLRSVFAKNKYQFQKFEELYDNYNFEIRKAVDSKTKKLPSKKVEPARPQLPSLDSLKDWLFQRPMAEELTLSSFSDIEVLTRKDFAQMSEDEIRLVVNVLSKLSKKILRRKSRTKLPSKKKRKIDMRMTLRSNLRTGPDINQVVFSELKERRLKLILICDVSKSMDLYSRFFIQLLYAFHQGADRLETFVFSTALHHITDLLDNHPFDEAFEMISDRVPQWSGGTKIGFCINRFWEDYGRRLLDRKTKVMILSDGWDTGESAHLVDAMKAIHKSARSVIWLNPLAGHQDFKPEVIGLKSALPYINRLHAAHNLSSLRDLLSSI